MCLRACSSMSDSVQSLVADLLSPIPDLPPHFGTLAVKAKAAELLNQLQAVGSGLAATPELQQGTQTLSITL